MAPFSDLSATVSFYILNSFIFVLMDVNIPYAGNNPTLQYSLLQDKAQLLARYNTGHVCAVQWVGR